MTQTTKSGSQLSLKSAISLKESIRTTPPMSTKSDYDKNIKYNERSVDGDSTVIKNGKYNDSKNMLSNYESKSREFLTSSPIENTKSPYQQYPSENMKSPYQQYPQQQQQAQPLRSTTPTPIPASRKSAVKNSTSRTHLIEGIPQTEV
jgi:hypothetical protein